MADKAFGCALTHVRHEGYFLEKWLTHYGAIFGRENLHVVIDGDDWEPAVDLGGVSVEMLTDAPRRRMRNDRFMAKQMSLRANRLRERYRYVVRTDVDEFVTLDPASGLDWPAGLAELGKHGYVHAVGVDMVQTAGDTAPVDRARPILAQRRHGFVNSFYSKPFVISRRAEWSGGAHRLIGRKVRMSPHFILFHMALADAGIMAERHHARGGDGQHKSFLSHIAERTDGIGEMAPPDALDFDEARRVALAEFPVNADGQPAKRPQRARDPRALERGLPVRVPDRFAGLA